MKARLRPFPLLVVLLAVALPAAYSNHFDNGFHFDDSHTIRDNIYIRDIGNIPLFFQDSKTFSVLPSNQTYRPLTSTTLAIDYRLGGGQPLYFHLSTFFWYLVQCILMFFLFSYVIRKSQTHPWNHYFGLFACGLYALHTANAETIN